MEYRIAKGACVDRVADETVVTLPTGDVVVLNAAAAVVFGAVVSGGADLDEAASLLARRYDVKIDRARRDARICIARLRGEGVIEPKRRTLAHTRVEAPVLSRRHFLGGTLSAAAFAAISAGNAFADSDGARFGYWENSSVVDRRRIWHDSRGFSVSLPEKIKKVAPVGSFAHSVMESIDPSMIVRATNWGMRASVASDAEEAGSELGESSGACLCGFVLEAEEADIVLSIVPADSPLASNEMAARNDAGVPIVHMVAGANDLPDLYEALADLLENEHAREIGEYLADLLRLLDWSKFSMAQESRKSAYVGMGDSGLNTRGSNTVLSAALDSAGALNAARDMRGAVVGLSAADVAATSPDLAIVCPSGASFNRTLSAEALAMWFDGGELSGLCPVLLEPLTPYGWLDRSPLVIYTIGALWVAAALYRDDCDFDIGVVASEYWDYLFGVDISSDDVLATLEASDLSSLPSSLFAETDSSIEDDDCGESYDSPDIEVISAGSIASARSFMGSGGGGGGGATGGGEVVYHMEGANK